MAMPGPVGEQDRNAAIWRAYCGGRSQYDIAAEHGISQQRVSQIIRDWHESVPRVTREDMVRREIAFLDGLREEAMKIVAESPAPVTAGKDGDIVRDPEHKGPDGLGRVVRDHSGRLAAMNMAHATNASMRKLLGLDAPTKTEITGGVKHEIVGVDPEDLV